ncbi:hypothetical protein PIB30_032550 [Stylosanthes scabra]|uniref:Uncharacterized protein n=1 Tax=Stylosanthes scabra TaxID=79078 RepID=A0ABU6ZCJ6_9FABA|nr:hypothetical protein [Stylosanthes scabra]
MTFAELQSGLCECKEGHVLMSVNRILYRMPVQIFGEAIHFDIMAIVDEVSMRQKVQQCGLERPRNGYKKQTVLEENLSNSEDKLEAYYEVGDEDKDDGEERAIVALQSSGNNQSITS